MCNDNHHLLTIMKQHQELIHDIIALDYYTELLEPLIESYTYIDWSPNLVCQFWNDFWNALPDSPVIHREPFYRICDMAEGSYLDEEYA